MAYINATSSSAPSPASSLGSYRAPIAALAYAIGYASLTFGLVGNAMIVALFHRRCFVNAPTRVLLILLSCSDSTVLLVSLTRFISVTLYSFDIRLLSLALCRGHTYVTYMATDMSSWCLCLVCFERLLAVAAPTVVKRVCRPRNILLTYGCLLAASGCKNLPLLLGLQLLSATGGVGRCIGVDTAAVRMLAFYLGDFFLRVALPAVFVLTVNVALLTRLSQMASGTAVASSLLRKEFRIFRMLLAVSLYFFVSMLPGRALFLYTFMNPSTGRYRELLDFVYNLLIIVAYTNHAINFYLYLASSAGIRAMLVAMATCRRHRVAARAQPVTMVPAARETS